MKIFISATKVLFSQFYQNASQKISTNVIQQTATIIKKFIKQPPKQLLPKKLKQLQIKACISSTLIREIQTSYSYPQKILPHSSLTQHLIQTILNYDNSTQYKQEQNIKNINLEQIKKEFYDLISANGIKLPNQLAQQNKFYQSEKKSSIKRISTSRIVFYPTVSVTAQIFNQILRSQKYSLIVGRRGISKSMSIIFQKILYDHIATYKWTLKDNENNDDINIQTLFDIFDYKQTNMIPKIIYWSVDLSKHCNLENVKSLFLNQCPQVNKPQLQNILLNISKPEARLNQIYQKKKISLILVVDEYDQIIEAYQNKLKLQGIENYHDQVVKSQQKCKLISSIRLTQKQIEQNYQKSQKIVQIISQIKQQFDNIIFVASSQSQLLQQEYLSFSTSSHHSPISNHFPLLIPFIASHQQPYQIFLTLNNKQYNLNKLQFYLFQLVDFFILQLQKLECVDEILLPKSIILGVINKEENNSAAVPDFKGYNENMMRQAVRNMVLKLIKYQIESIKNKNGSKYHTFLITFQNIHTYLLGTSNIHVQNVRNRLKKCITKQQFQTQIKSILKSICEVQFKRLQKCNKAKQ